MEEDKISIDLDEEEAKQEFGMACQRIRLMVRMWTRRARTLRFMRHLRAGRLLPLEIAQPWACARIAPFL